MPKLPDTGTYVDGRYLLSKVLGTGGSGSVYLAVDEDLKRQVAIKFLNVFQGTEGQADTLARFEREARALSQLLHPSIVRVFRFGVSAEGSPYIVMEFLEGTSLRDLIAKEKQLSCKLAVAIAQQLASALEYAHGAAIVHRDLKPENIIVQESPQGISAKIFDFGLSRQSGGDQSTLTETGFLVGTAAYMSPEQCMGKDVDWRTDIYSFACLLFEMITGMPPFQGSTATDVLVQQLSDPMPRILELSPKCGLPVELQNLILDCGKKKKQERCQSFSHVSTVLDELEAMDCSAKFIPGFEARSKAALGNFRISKGAVFASLLIAVLSASALFGFVFFTEKGNITLVDNLQSSQSEEDAISNLSAMVKTLSSSDPKRARQLIESSTSSEAFRSWAPPNRQQLLQHYLQVSTEKNWQDKTFELKIRLMQELLDSLERQILKRKRKKQHLDEQEVALLDRLSGEFLESNFSGKQWARIEEAIDSRWSLAPGQIDPHLSKLAVLRCESRRLKAGVETNPSELTKMYDYTTRIVSLTDDEKLLQRISTEGLKVTTQYGSHNRETEIHISLGMRYLKYGKLEKAKEELALAKKASGDITLSGAEQQHLEDLEESCKIGKPVRHKKKIQSQEQ